MKEADPTPYTVHTSAKLALAELEFNREKGGYTNGTYRTTDLHRLIDHNPTYRLGNLCRDIKAANQTILTPSHNPINISSIFDSLEEELHKIKRRNLVFI